MPTITVLPHATLCPEGLSFETETGVSVCDALLAHGIHIEHACGKCGVCATCHVLVREGYDSLPEPSELEEDMLDRAWGLEAVSRLSCQAIVGTQDLVIELPRYTRNHAREN